VLTPGRRRPGRDRQGPSTARAIDPLALLAVAVIAGLGALNLVAIGDRGLAVHQLLAVLAGVGLLVLLLRVRPASLPLLGWAVYGAAVFMLLAVLAKGRGAYGAQRWLSLGPIDLQPSELAKLGVLLLLADILGMAGAGWRRASLAIAAASIPIALTLRQPDLSTATVLVLLTLVLLVVARAPLALVAGILAAGAAAAPLAGHVLRPYQLARLDAFLSGPSSATGSGWAVLQARIAVGWGGLYGTARDPLHLLLASYLPARESDLAFASLVEQWGLAAGALAVGAVALLLWRLVRASRRARTRQGTLVAAGLALLVGCETVISVGGNLGVLPLAGVPFPFLSYGGTVAAVHLAALGVALAGPVEAGRRRLWMQRWGRRPQPRLVRLGALALAGLLATLSVFAWHLQQVSGEQLRRTGEYQMSRCAPVPAPRGIITDRHGVPVATDTPSDRVLVAPGVLRGQPKIAQQLAALAGVAPAVLRRLLDQPADGPMAELGIVPAAVGNRIEFSHLPGVVVAQAPRRAYPYGALLGPLLGYTGLASADDLGGRPALDLNSYVGRAGLERSYDSVLRGVDGSQCFFVDPAGATVAPAGYTPPVPGSDVRLTLDLALQQEAASALADALRGVPGQPRGDQGAVVVMDAATGALLAMASLPAYDDNLFGPPGDPAAIARAGAAPGNPMLEHATQVAVPPGSTFKLVVGAADTVFDAIPPGRVIPTGYTFSYGDHTYHGWGPLPPQNLTQAIGWSNDVYFYKLALALGPDRVHQVGSQLGAGQPTGIDLPGESAGLLGTPDSVERAGGTWYSGTTVILGIGQGEVLATPLQDARWTAAVTTGQLVTPHLGLAFQSGGVAAALPSRAPAPLPFAAGLGPVRDGMRLAADQGTATIVRDVPMPAGAKTGTAEDPSTPSGGEDAWFTAVVPFDHPQVVVTAMVRGGGEGGNTSGPVVDRLLRYYAAHRDAITSTAPFGPPPLP